MADEHHHEGAATLLLERLAVIAKRCGFHFLTALTLPDNTEMRLVFHTVGLPEHSRFDDEDGRRVRSLVVRAAAREPPSVRGSE